MMNRLAALSGVALVMCWGGARAEAQSVANPWVPCGLFEDLRGPNRCEIDGFPLAQYEYGFSYLPHKEVFVANCLFWNQGMRVMNRTPYATNSDNPSIGFQLGGAVFYTETLAADDDIPNSCPSGTWRHRYWRIAANGNVVTEFSNGCYNLTLFCRKRT